MSKVPPYFLYVSICHKLHRKVKFVLIHDTHTKWLLRVHLHIRSTSWLDEKQSKEWEIERKRKIQFRASRERNDEIGFENSSLLSISWVAYLMFSQNAARSFECLKLHEKFFSDEFGNFCDIKRLHELHEWKRKWEERKRIFLSVNYLIYRYLIHSVCKKNHHRNEKREGKMEQCGDHWNTNWAFKHCLKAIFHIE